MAIVEDSSTPAVTRSTTATQASVVSPLFSPPANSLLVAIFSIGTTSQQPAQPHAIVDSLGGIWVYAAHVDGGAVSAFGMGTIWTRQIGGSAPGAMTVTATRTGTSTVAMTIAVRVLTGAKQDQIGSIQQHFNTGTGNAVDTLAPGKIGSIIYILCCTGSNTPTYTPTADTTNIDLWSSSGILGTVIIGKSNGLTGNTNPTVYGWTSAAGSLQVSWLAIEILPAIVQDEGSKNSLYSGR